MMQIRLFVIALSVLLTIGTLAYAQNDSMTISGTIGGEVAILPTFGVSTTLDLSLSLADLTFESKTTFDIYPALGGTENLSVEHAWNTLTIGTGFGFSRIPPGLDSVDAYADARVFDLTTGDGGMEFAGALRAEIGIFPNFSGSLTGTLSADIGIISLSSVTTVDLLPLGFSAQEFTAALTFLDATLGDDGPASSGKLTGDFTLYPAFSGSTWLSLSASLDGTTFESKTTFGIAPFAFSSQYFKASFDLTPFSFYVSAILTTGSPQAEAGFSYAFP